MCVFERLCFDLGIAFMGLHCSVEHAEGCLHCRVSPWRVTGVRREGATPITPSGCLSVVTCWEAVLELNKPPR